MQIDFSFSLNLYNLKLNQFKYQLYTRQHPFFIIPFGKPSSPDEERFSLLFLMVWQRDFEVISRQKTLNSNLNVLDLSWPNGHLLTHSHISYNNNNIVRK